MILHTFNSPRALQVSGAFVQENDQVLFLEDGVYCLLGRTLNLASNHLHVLRPDMDARGLSDRVDPEIHRANYETFVQLCCDADSISNWF